MSKIYEIWLSLAYITPYALTLLITLLLLEQILYQTKKSTLPGPSCILPFLGNVISLIKNPEKFWEDQAEYARSSSLGVSANYVIGKFIVFMRDSEMSHKVLANVSPNGFQFVGHPFGKRLFGEQNMIYLFGHEHKDLRRRMAINFTPNALATYTSIQQVVILNHFKRWLDMGPGPLRVLARDMNLETSQDVFVGPYMGPEARKRFGEDYSTFNVGVLALPIDLPGFKFRNARLAVDRLVEALTKCVVESKSRMRLDGEEPKCMIDFWMQDMVKEEKESLQKSTPVQTPPNCSDREIGAHMFDLLFASQDASTSSLLWAVSLLDSHPDVVRKVREEVESIWNPKSNTLITNEKMLSMKYTYAVAREILRYRPPATLMPHVTLQDFQLTSDYTIPKGSIVFPSAYESSFQGFNEPYKFDPDRFYSEERREDQVFKKNYLVFGAGGHQCVGQRYAVNVLVLFIAMFVTLIDFKRVRTVGCDDLAFVPTICPKDDCLVTLSKRCEFPCIELA